MKMQFYPDDIQRHERDLQSLSSKEETADIEKYYDFFNAETVELAALSFEQLMERQQKYRDILFENRTKLKANINAINERIKKMSQEEREQYEIDGLEVTAQSTNLSGKTPYAKAEKKVRQKAAALDALSSLGLDANAILNMAMKFGTDEKGKALKAKHDEAIKVVEQAKQDEPKEEKVIRSGSFLAAFNKK